jgi:hypothetical protein
MGAASGRNTPAAPEQPTESPDSEIEEHKAYLLSIKDTTHQYLSESDFATSNGYYWHQNILWKGTHSWRAECIVAERFNTETGQSDMLVVWSELDDSNAWTQMSKEDNMWVSYSLTPESLLSEWSTSGRRRAWLCFSGHTITTTAEDAPTDRSNEGTDWSSTDDEAEDEDGGSKDERYSRQVNEQEPYCKDEREHQSKLHDLLQQMEQDHQDKLQNLHRHCTGKDKAINNLMKDLNILRENSDDKDEQCEQMSKKIEELQQFIKDRQRAFEEHNNWREDSHRRSNSTQALEQLRQELDKKEEEIEKKEEEIERLHSKYDRERRDALDKQEQRFRVQLHREQQVCQTQIEDMRRELAFDMENKDRDVAALNQELNRIRGQKIDTVQQQGMGQHTPDMEDSDVFRKQRETSEINRQLFETQIASKDRELAALTQELERVNGKFLEAAALSTFSQERKEDSERFNQLKEENDGLHDQLNHLFKSMADTASSEKNAITQMRELERELESLRGVEGRYQNIRGRLDSVCCEDESQHKNKCQQAGGCVDAREHASHRLLDTQRRQPEGNFYGPSDSGGDRFSGVRYWHDESGHDDDHRGFGSTARRPAQYGSPSYTQRGRGGNESRASMSGGMRPECLSYAEHKVNVAKEGGCFNREAHCAAIETLKEQWEGQFIDKLRKLDQEAFSRTTVEELLREVFESREDPLHQFDLGKVSGYAERVHLEQKWHQPDSREIQQRCHDFTQASDKQGGLNSFPEMASTFFENNYDSWFTTQEFEEMARRKSTTRVMIEDKDPKLPDGQFWTGKTTLKRSTAHNKEGTGLFEFICYIEDYSQAKLWHPEREYERRTAAFLQGVKSQELKHAVQSMVQQFRGSRGESLGDSAWALFRKALLHKYPPMNWRHALMTEWWESTVQGPKDIQTMATSASYWTNVVTMMLPQHQKLPPAFVGFLITANAHPRLVSYLEQFNWDCGDLGLTVALLNRAERFQEPNYNRETKAKKVESAAQRDVMDSDLSEGQQAALKIMRGCSSDMQPYLAQLAEVLQDAQKDADTRACRKEYDMFDDIPMPTLKQIVGSVPRIVAEVKRLVWGGVVEAVHVANNVSKDLFFQRLKDLQECTLCGSPHHVLAACEKWQPHKPSFTSALQQNSFQRHTTPYRQTSPLREDKYHDRAQRAADDQVEKLKREIQKLTEELRRSQGAQGAGAPPHATQVNRSGAARQWQKDQRAAAAKQTEAWSREEFSAPVHPKSVIDRHGQDSDVPSEFDTDVHSDISDRSVSPPRTSRREGGRGNGKRD